MGRLGAHVSISGGVAGSIGRAISLSCETFQIFTRNQRQWEPPPIGTEEVRSFKEKLSSSDLGPVLVHGSYLINPAGGNPDVRERSLKAFTDEILRCALLGLDRLVIHPGSHGGSGERIGILRAAEILDLCYEEASISIGSGVELPKVLLETTAGQGTGIGHTFGQLSEIIDSSSFRDHLGICLDTCHMHSSGLDLTTSGSYDEVMKDLERTIGTRKVLGIHLNDCKKDLGSRVDRHANIGEGTIGLEAFRLIVNDRRFDDIPLILETPGGETMYAKELELLRSFRSKV